MARFFARIKSFFLRLFGRKQVPLLENRVFFHYPQGFAEDVEDDVYYSDSYFLNDSHEDNPSLATCSLGFAMASFSSNRLKEGMGNQAQNAVEFLHKCGFSNVETPKYFGAETSEEGIAFAVGKKTIGRGKKAFTLIAIGIRGGNYGKEWASNIRVGLGDRHEGFSSSAQRLRDAFDNYVGRHQIKGPIRVWVSGFSRAAAVCNLFAKDLPLGEGKHPIADVYAYCFACPNTTKVGALAKTSIRNYVNPVDLVPMVPLYKWGYSRYGTDVSLPLEDGARFDRVYLDMRHILNKNKRFRREENADKGPFLDELCSLFGERISLYDFVHRFQDILCGFMSLIDTKLENPYQVMVGAIGDAVSHVVEQFGAFSLLRMLNSPKTDWDAALRPVLEESFRDKPYVLDASEVSKALSDFLYLIRQDVLEQPNFFLTLGDKSNLSAIFGEHKAVRYLAALKKKDPKYQ